VEPAPAAAPTAAPIAFAAAGHAANEGAERRAAARANGGRFAFAAALDVAFFVNFLDRVFAIDLLDLGGHGNRLAVFEANGVERERKLGFAFELAGLVNFGDVSFDGRVGIRARREHGGFEPVAVFRFFRVNFVFQANLHLGASRNGGHSLGGCLADRPLSLLRPCVGCGQKRQRGQHEQHETNGIIRGCMHKTWSPSRSW
jgi:hypothetical protein